MNAFQKGCLAFTILISIASIFAGWKKSHWYILIIGLVITFTLGFLQPDKIGKTHLSREAELVQRLLRGEEVPLANIDIFARAAKAELKLPDDLVRKLGNHARYSIRFNANNVLTSTNK